MLAQIYNQIDTAIKWVDDRIWGLPLIILILTTGSQIGWYFPGRCYHLG